MIKTDFMKLLEELDAINEAVNDIDFKVLDNAEREVERLEREIHDLELNYDRNIYSAYSQDDQYKQLTAEIRELQDQLEKLSKTYKGRVYTRELNAYGDEYEVTDWYDWFNDEAYEKVKDRVTELEAKKDKLEDALNALINKLSGRALQQAKPELDNIKAKKAEYQKQSDIASDHRTKLKQSAGELKPELQAIVDYLKSEAYYDELQTLKLNDEVIYSKKHGRILATASIVIKDPTDYYAPYRGEITDDFDPSSGELRFLYDVKCDPDTVLADIAADQECHPKQYCETLEHTEGDWFKLPNSDWELSAVPDFEIIEEPILDTYSEDEFSIFGELVIEVIFTFGKKV